MFDIGEFMGDKITSVIELNQKDILTKMYINMDIDFPSSP